MLYNWRYNNNCYYIFVIAQDFYTFAIRNGGLAQLARALAWHARGHRFDSDILHQTPSGISEGVFYIPSAKRTLLIYCAWL